MPSIPIYRRRELSQPTPGIRVSAASPVSAFMEPGRELLEQGLKIAHAAQDEADKADYSESYAKLLTLKNQLTWGKDGLMSRLGKNAMGADKDLLSAFDKGVQEIGKTKTSGQKAAFEKLYLQHRTDFAADIDRHGLAQTKQWEEASRKASLDAVMNDSIVNFRTRDLRLGIREIARISSEEAQANGLGKDWAAMKARERGSMVIAGITERMVLAGDYAGAQQFFNKYRKVLDEKQEADVDKFIKDPNIAFKQAFRTASQGQGKEEIPKEYTDLLTPPQQQSIQETRQLLASGQTPVTDQAIKQNLLDWAAQATVDPAQKASFLRQDMDFFYPRLSPGDLSMVKGLQQKLQDGKEDGELAQVKVNKTLFDEALAGMKITAPFSSKERKEMAVFKARIEDRLNQMTQETGKKPSYEDNKRVISEMLKEGIVKDAGFLKRDIKKKTYQLKPGEVFADQGLGAATVSSGGTTAPAAARPSPEERKALAADLALHNKAVTESNIMKLWERKKSLGK